MCGIIGFTGKLKAQDVLLTGLASLEYRGYDSAGIAYFKDTGKISLRKTVHPSDRIWWRDHDSSR